MTKIILDTDIGSDIDDAVCLAYLLANPACELLGVTTVSGEPERRAMMVSALAKVAGKEFPIYVGAGEPLIIEQRQKKAPQADVLDNWPHETDFPQREAVNFLRRTIRANPGEITLLTIGPLTNIGLLFAIDPEIPSLLKELVIMGGYYLKEDALEWNLMLDPHAADIVYRAEPPRHRSIGIDVTKQVTMQADTVRQRFNTRLLRPVLDFAEVWFKEQDIITFHDPLAATVIFDDSLCTFERGTVQIEIDNKEMHGRSAWQAGDGHHEIATTVKSDNFFQHFFSYFQEA